MAETPREVIEAFVAEQNAGEFEKAWSRFAPDAQFWVAGREWSVGGTYDLAGVQKVQFEAIGSRLAGPMTLEVVGITAEGERVAVELEGDAPTTDGRRYQNQYHFLFVVRDGKIVLAKEYQDTLHSSIVIGA